MDVTTILDELRRNANTNLLTQLKELARDPVQAQLYTSDDIDFLCSLAVRGFVEAQRCIANALTLNDAVVSSVKTSLPDLLKHSNQFDRFVLLRIVFLVTAKGRCSCNTQLLRDYLREASSNNWSVELLKVIYNVMIFGDERFDGDQLASLLPYAELVPHLINLMTVQQFTTYEVIQPIFSGYVDALLEHSTYAGIAIGDDQMIPMLKAVSMLEPSDLIVPAAERDVPLGQSSSLAARLLRLMNTGTQAVRECVANLLYNISGSPEQFVEDVGYGHAVGFLTAHGLVPKLPGTHAGIDINPVTGQNLANEPHFAEMSDDEKEREAEKLFVLFQRMKRNGVINVQDPIQEAVDSGKFQEM